MTRGARRLNRWIGVLGSILALTAAHAWAEDQAPSPGYPRLLAFRTAGAAKTEAEYAPYALFDFVHAGGDPALIRKFNADVRMAHHWRLGVAYKPGVKLKGASDIKHPLGQRLWPGHWLLYNGTKLTQDLAAEASATILSVEDTRVFQDPSESPAEFGPDDIQIYALDEHGRAQWDHCEQVVLQSIDAKAGAITVRRGKYLSKPLAFKAGRAVAAVHARTAFLFGPDPQMWRVNFTLHCPRDADGLTGAQFSGRFLGEALRDDALDGAEFDVGEWGLSSKTVTKDRTYDADNDLRLDGCLFRHEGLGVVNEHGLGQVVCVREMRSIIGPGKILQADVGMRAYPYLNGIEEEFYPCGQRQDPRVASLNYDQLLYCLSRCPYEPKISYLMGKFPTARYNNEPDKPWSDGWYRMGIASALSAGAYYTYNAASTLPGGKGEVGLGFGRFYMWDEYDGGALKKKHYLGQPLEPAQPLPGQTGADSVLAPLERAEAKCKGGYKAACAYNPKDDVLRIEILEQEEKPSLSGVTVCCPAREGVQAPPDSPFTLRGEVRAQTVYGSLDPSFKDVPAALPCALQRALGKEKPRPLMADEQWRPFSASLYCADSFEGLFVHLGDEPGAFEFRGLKLLAGDAFVLYRRFENGIALFNGSARPVVFDLSRIDPEREYQAIQGTITPQINDGRPIRGPLMLDPFDGRVLLARGKI